MTAWALSAAALALAAAVAALALEHALRLPPPRAVGVAAALAVSVVLPFARSGRGPEPVGAAGGVVDEAARRAADETNRRIEAAVRTHFPAVYRDGTEGRQFVFFLADAAGNVQRAGTSAIPESEWPVWSSKSLEADLRARFPGVRVANTFFHAGMRLRGDTGPRTNVAWVVVE